MFCMFVSSKCRMLDYLYLKLCYYVIKTYVLRLINFRHPTFNCYVSGSGGRLCGPCLTLTHLTVTKLVIVLNIPAKKKNIL